MVTTAPFYNWDLKEKSNVDIYFKILCVAFAVTCFSIFPAVVTSVTMLNFQPSIFYYSFFSEHFGKYDV